MKQLSVQLFGRFVARYDDSEPIRFTSHKEEELFCFLVIHRGQPRAREVVASMLWGDTTTSRSKRYLRTALWHLRSDLEQPAPCKHSLLSASNSWLQICTDAPLWADVDALQRAYERIRGVSPREWSEDEAESVASAIELYKGVLLEGWYQDWCLYERERLQHMSFELADKMMTYCEVGGQFDRGIALGMRLLRDEPAREGTHRRLMRLYYLKGDRSSSLRQYRLCRQTLTNELDVPPSRRTELLHQQIREDKLAPEASGTERKPPQSSLSPVTVLQDVAASVSQLQSALDDMQKRLSNGLDALSR